jgi:hypothetical protein
MSWSALGQWTCAVSFAAASLTVARPVEAHGQEVVGVVLIPLLGDTVFTVYDFVAFADDDRSKGWLITQTVWATPQALLLGMDHFSFGAFPLGISIWADQLSAFGVYGLASPSVSTTTLYGLSWAIGANTAITTKAIALALDGEWSPRTIAITELVAAAPQLAVAGYALASPESIPHQRAAVLALGGWSSAILLHGVASLIWYRPKPPPEPKRAWQLAPGMLPGERGLAPGLVAVGTL